MKKSVSSILTLFILILFVGCSSDDDEVFVSKVPGESLKEEQIQIVFSATEENHILKFSVNSDYTGSLEVEWGEKSAPKAQKYTSKSDIYYDFPVQSENYVITVNVSQLKSIAFDDASTPNIRGLYLGDCSSLESFSMNGSLSNLETLDINNCPRFWGGSFTVFANNEKFNFDGLKKAGSIVAYVKAPIAIDLSNSDIESFTLFQLTDYIPSLHVESCSNLDYLSLNKGTDGYSWPKIGNIDVKNTTLSKLGISAIKSDSLDISEAGNGFEAISLSYFDAGFIKWNKALKYISMRGGSSLDVDYNANYQSTIRVLDFSDCEQLEELSVEFFPILKDIKVGGLQTLKFLWLQGNGDIEKLDISDMPSLASVYLFTHKNLESATFKNLPLLANLSLTNSSKFSSIDAGSLPLLASVELENNNLDENEIKLFFSHLANQLTTEGNQRSIKIKGNPGDTENIRSIIQKSGNWQVINDENSVTETRKSLSKQGNEVPKLMSGTVK